MAGKEPLLGTLKACVLGLQTDRLETITDDSPHVTPLCDTIEMILRKGLKSGVLGLRKRDYWHWIEELPQYDPCGRLAHISVLIEKTLACPKVLTPQGRGRYFLRMTLNGKTLAATVQHLQHTQKLLEGCVNTNFKQTCEMNLENVRCWDGSTDSELVLLVPVQLFSETEEVSSYTEVLYRLQEYRCWWYDPVFSVLGNEEHMEPFLSLLLVISQSTFNLHLQNASFLDESWLLPVCVTYQTVPCRELGMVLRYHEGRVFVVQVLPDSQTEVDEVVLAGDLIDEINGVSLRNAYNGQAGTVLNKLKGEPLIFQMIRWRWKDGELFRPLIPYLKGVKERVPNFQLQQHPRNLEASQELPQQEGRLLYSVQYLGQADVGMFGGKEILDVGITRVRKQNSLPRDVLLDIKETEIAVKDKESSEVLFQYSYPEISSVGRRMDNKSVFALCAVEKDTDLDVPSFSCFVFQAPSNKECEEMIKRIAAGFKHTEWFV